MRLTDNGDNDGVPDANETVSVYVTLRNRSGSDQQGIVVRMGSTDPTVACIPTPVVSFGSLLAGEVREAAVPLVFQMTNVVRADVLQDLLVTLDFAVSGDDFGTTAKPQSVTLEADLNVSGGLLPTSYTEGFENAGFGSFTTQSLDIGRESLLGSDGHRCQYNDPDFVNSNSYRYTYCFLGAATTAQNAYDWHVHGLTSPDGGRAYLGNNSLHWGVHGGAAGQDTVRLRQLDAIRTFLPVNLGWNGVTSDLTFKHQVSLVDGSYLTGPDFGETVDRGIVQVQLANSAGQGTDSWRKISPYENVYNAETYDRYRNCLFDPTDDGSDEDDYFDPADPARRLGPSSTCRPEFGFSRLGETFFSLPFHPADIGDASDGPGLQGSRGPGTWVESKFSLARWRGRRVRFRFLATSIEIGDYLTWEQAQSWNPIPGDDGWYIDDVRVTNTLTSPATVLIDTADRSGLPACGPVCASVTPSLTALPAIAACGDTFTLDASGSTTDDCHGGELQFRFWWIWRPLPPGGTLNEFYAALLQDWSENATLLHPAQTFEENTYRVDVRCSTLPACGATTTAVVTVGDSCPVLLYFPNSIVFESKSVLSWGTPGRISAVRGDLGALRATGGEFSPSTYWNFQVSNRSSLEDASLPPAGEGRYYLVRGSRYPVPGSCARYSFSTGSPAELPGAGGDRDEDIQGYVPGCP